MSEQIRYLHLPPGAEPPEISGIGHFKAVLVIEHEVADAWRALISEWLVDTGCLYMMAWGRDCSTWDDAVDWANLEDFDFGEIPDERLVMTTWHEKQSLEEVFGFAKHAARHEHAELATTVIVHIGQLEKRDELTKAFSEART